MAQHSAPVGEAACALVTRVPSRQPSVEGSGEAKNDRGTGAGGGGGLEEVVVPAVVLVVVAVVGALDVLVLVGRADWLEDDDEALVCVGVGSTASAAQPARRKAAAAKAVIHAEERMAPDAP